MLEEAKTNFKDPGAIGMVEAAYIKIKDHRWYLSKRLAPRTLFSATLPDYDEKEMANAILKCQYRTRPDCQQTPEIKDFGAKRLKHFVGHDSRIVFEQF